MSEIQSEMEFALHLLIAHGKKEGQLTSKYIRKALEALVFANDMRVSSKQFEKMYAVFYSTLKANGVEVVEVTDEFDEDDILFSNNDVARIISYRGYILAYASDKVTSREESLLRFRWALTDGRLHTVSETAEQFHISVERVRQIENKVFRVCRPNAIINRAKEFLDS